MNMPLGVDIPREDGNVQQPRHPLSWQSQGQLLTRTRHLQKLAEKRLLRSLCCRPNCTVERHIPVFHPCAVLNRPAPAAIFTGFIRWTVARCVIVVAIGANKIWTFALRLFGIWSQVIGQNKAAINSMPTQRQGSVMMTKPQAEVENVYQTPLRWHQFAQLLLAQGCCKTNWHKVPELWPVQKTKKDCQCTFPNRSLHFVPQNNPFSDQQCPISQATHCDPTAEGQNIPSLLVSFEQRLGHEKFPHASHCRTIWLVLGCQLSQRDFTAYFEQSLVKYVK